MYKELADQLWDLTYQTFKKSGPSALFASMGVGSDRNELQHSMMKTISELKNTDNARHGQELANQVWADAMVAHARGWMTDETADKMQDLITQIMPIEK